MPWKTAVDFQCQDVDNQNMVVWIRKARFVKALVVTLVIAGLCEPIFCAALHDAFHQHFETGCSSPVDHDHDHDHEEAVDSCHHPDRHDCEGCGNHQHVAIRFYRADALVELVVLAVEFTAAAPSWPPALSDYRSIRVGAPPPSRQLQSALQTTILLI